MSSAPFLPPKYTIFISPSSSGIIYSQKHNKNGEERLFCLFPPLSSCQTIQHGYNFFEGHIAPEVMPSPVSLVIDEQEILFLLSRVWFTGTTSGREMVSVAVEVITICQARVPPAIADSKVRHCPCGNDEHRLAWLLGWATQ